MKLSVVERWILANQFRILENLDPSEAERYEKARDALESGYELEYDRISGHINRDGDTLSAQDCVEVLEILDMFRALARAYTDLSDRSGIDRERIGFSGFDANGESEHLNYSVYLGRTGRFTELVGKYGINSHHSTLPRYRKMVAEWKQSRSRFELKKDDIERIQRAGIFSHAELSSVAVD